MMKRVLFLSLSLILLASCSNPVTQTWSDSGRFSISPVTWGKSLWSKQNTLTMSGQNGKALWSSEYSNTKWLRTHNFAGNLIVVGDDRIIERIDENGKTLWTWEAPPKQLIYPFLVGQGNLICAIDINTDYNLNPISLMALNLSDGSISWTLDDHDYSGALTLDPLETKTNYLVIPTTVGESVFIESFSCKDGRFIWRKNWDKPPTGQHPILACDNISCVLWKKTVNGIEFGSINRKNGTIILAKLDESTSLLKKLYCNGELFLKFRNGTYKLGKDLSFTKLSSEWFPLCGIPGDETYLVQNSDCTYVAIADKNLSNVQKSFKTDVCYTGIAGHGFGEVYLKPTLSPLDFKALRCVAYSKQFLGLGNIPKILTNLSKGAKLTDLFIIVQPLQN